VEASTLCDQQAKIVYVIQQDSPEIIIVIVIIICLLKQESKTVSSLTPQ
jgi:hypothetical protein